MTEILKDIRKNGDERPWQPWKHKSRILSASYYRISQATHDEALYRASARVFNCADDIEFSNVITTTGERKRKLTAANFCRDRLCPMCQWRKSLVMFTQLSRTMNYIEAHPEKYGEVRCLFLTLTVKNCKADELTETLSDMFSAWQRLNRMLKKKLSYKGSYRALEVTINEETGEYHPHFHVLLLVSPEYFKSDYMKQTDYIALWRKALQVDYDPGAHINRMKNSKPKAIAEVAKYTVKPGDWLSFDTVKTDAHIATLREALHGRRLVSFTGILKEARKALKLIDVDRADLIQTDEDELIRGDVVECIEHYRWTAGVGSFGRFDYMKTMERFPSSFKV